MKFWSSMAALILFCSNLVAQDLPEDWICKERIQMLNRLERRSNSGVKHGYLIDYYRCKWWVNPRRGSYFKGDVMAHFTVTSPTDSVGFDLSDKLFVDQVYGAAGNLSYRRAGNYMYVFNKQGWKVGERDSIGIRYQGNPVNNGGFGYFVFDNHMKGPIVHTLSQPYGAQYWWPCKQSLHDKIDSIDIWVYTDTGMKVASNGLLVRSKVISDTSQLYIWKHRYPIATYLVAIAVTNYAEYTDSVYWAGGGKPMPVLNYVFPQFLSTAKQETKGVLPLLRLFDSLFVRYPFAKEKYGHAQFTWGGGMEHQTMSFMVNFSFDLMAHEVAHMWFGDMVTCGSWQDLWLNEGFATYLNTIAVEYLKSKEDSYQRLRGMRGDITGKDNGSVFPKDTLSVGGLFNGRLTYNKGAWVLHMLRDKIGDSAFFMGCRIYLNGSDRAYGFGYTPALKSSMEQASGRKLDTFFTQWYYGEGFPYLKIHWQQRGSQMKITVDQIPSNSSVPFWNCKVPLLIQGRGLDTLIVLEPVSLHSEKEITLSFSADSMIFDPFVKVLAKASIGGLNMDKIQNEPFIVSPNPVTSMARIFARNPSNFEGVIYDAVGQKIWSGSSQETSINGLAISMDTWPSGPYFLLINDNNFVYSYKIIKL
ncbi:MAG: T9SS type A sorting domain-containing protein [Flavobacteriaceae bacterium]|nr:T9SS type A sorting domain-containing protein [Flavobacteriaceae bacterium]